MPSKTLEIVVVEIFVGDAIWEEEEEAEILDVDAKVTFALADNLVDAKVNIS